MLPYTILVLTILFLPEMMEAQCAMCKATAEQGELYSTKGLNTGIMILFCAPYIMVGTIAFLWWRNRKTQEELEAEYGNDPFLEMDKSRLN